MSGIFLIIVIAWVMFSTLWDDRQTNKQRMPAEMKEVYSKHEALNLIYETKSQVMVLFLAYGFLIGVALVAMITLR